MLFIMLLTSFYVRVVYNNKFEIWMSEYIIINITIVVSRDGPCLVYVKSLSKKMNI